jgi:radical SAM enzyme (rSAM/lipoprotein system)
MSRARLRRLLHPLYRRLETTVHPLRYLFIEITQRCNLRCLHCGSDCTRETRPDELSTQEWLDFFGRLARGVDPRRIMLVVTGGEPLCHPELERLADGLRARGLRWGMVTNAWALEPRRLQALRERGLVSVTVSLDGLEASHDWLRGRPTSFARAVAGLQLLVQAGLPFMDVVTCAHPRNLDELPEVLSLLRRLGVPAWRLFSIFPKGRARENPELLLPPAGFRRLLDFVAATRRSSPGLRVDFCCEGHLPPALDAAVRDEPYFCRAGIAIGSVLCDGAISACPNISRSLVQGNVRTDDFLEVWATRFQPFRDRRWMRTGPCAACAHWRRCQGNSLHLWDAEAGQTGCCSLALVEPGT